MNRIQNRTGWSIIVTIVVIVMLLFGSGPAVANNQQGPPNKIALETGKIPRFGSNCNQDYPTLNAVLDSNDNNNNDNLNGSVQEDCITGYGGNDTLNGNEGYDLLIGVNPNHSSPGQGEIDTLIGGPGSDVFFLADDDNTYYDDGMNGVQNNQGANDYALIMDYDLSEDVLQVGDQLTILESTSITLPGDNHPTQGTGIYLYLSTVSQGAGKGDFNDLELIGFLPDFNYNPTQAGEQLIFKAAKQ